MSPKKWFVMGFYGASSAPVLIPTSDSEDGLFTSFDMCKIFYDKINETAELNEVHFMICETIYG